MLQHPPPPPSLMTVRNKGRRVSGSIEFYICSGLQTDGHDNDRGAGSSVNHCSFNAEPMCMDLKLVDNKIQK